MRGWRLDPERALRARPSSWRVVDAVELVEAVGEGVDETLLGVLVAETAGAGGGADGVVGRSGHLERDGTALEVTKLEARAVWADLRRLDRGADLASRNTGRGLHVVPISRERLGGIDMRRRRAAATPEQYTDSDGENEREPGDVDESNG